MGLITLTSGTTFALDEKNILRVYTLGSQTKVDYIDVAFKRKKNITVSESLAAIRLLSKQSLIAITVDSQTVLINTENINFVETKGSGTKIHLDFYGDIISIEAEETLAEMLVLKPSAPLKYKALISQNAPIVTTQTPTIVAGQIWEDTIGTADAGDLVILGGYELISGVLGAINAKYRSAIADTPIFVTSSFAYDGTPYVVSTDANGAFNPVTDTVTDVVLNYRDAGDFTITSTSGKFLEGKTFIKHKSLIMYYNGFGYAADAVFVSRRVKDNIIQLYTQSGVGGADTNDLLTNEPFEIKIYPYTDTA